MWARAARASLTTCNDRPRTDRVSDAYSVLTERRNEWPMRENKTPKRGHLPISDHARCEIMDVVVAWGWMWSWPSFVCVYEETFFVAARVPYLAS